MSVLEHARTRCVPLPKLFHKNATKCQVSPKVYFASVDLTSPSLPRLHSSLFPPDFGCPKEGLKVHFKLSLSLLRGNTSTPKNHHWLGCHLPIQVDSKTSIFLVWLMETEGKGFRWCHVSAKNSITGLCCKTTGQVRSLQTKRRM